MFLIKGDMAESLFFATASKLEEFERRLAPIETKHLKEEEVRNEQEQLMKVPQLQNFYINARGKLEDLFLAYKVVHSLLFYFTWKNS